METCSGRILAAACAVVLTAACGGDDKSSSTGEADEPSVKAPAPTEATPRPEPTAPAAATGPFDPAAVCDALDTDGIAVLVDASVQETKSADRSIMEQAHGHCQIVTGSNQTIEIDVYDGAEQRFTVNKGGGRKVPLLEQPYVRPLDGLGDRAAVVWAGPDTDNKSNNIRSLVVDFGDVGVQVSFRGFDTVRTPDRFVAIVGKVQSDLEL